ncbi:hypothetical protein BH11ARM2_BH11ARM2_31920 [soil metagenome]
MRISKNGYELDGPEKVEEMPLSDVPTDREFDEMLDDVRRRLGVEKVAPPPVAR